MKTIYKTGRNIITFLGLNLFLSAIFLAFGFQISQVIFFVSSIIFLSLFILEIATLPSERKTTTIAFIAFTLIFILCLATSRFFYDFSWDGQSYHQEALLQLRNGWNPFHQKNLFDYISNTSNALSNVPNDGTFKAPLWISHYPQGLWYMQTVLFDLTGKIECGKAINFLLYIATFLISFRTINLFIKKNIINFFLSISVIINPVITNQLFTFYNDGIVYLLLVDLLGLSILWFFDEENPIQNLISISFVLMIIINLKFTALGYTLLFILIPLGLIVKQAIDAKDIQQLWKKKNIIAYSFVSISLIISVAFIGFASYTTNFTQEGHPFYPLSGKNKVDIMSYNYVNGIDELNRLESFYVSQFAITSNNRKMPARIKFPLQITPEEKKEMIKPDTRIGGFGPLFGMTVILMIISLTYLLTKKQKSMHDLINIAFLPILVTTIIFISIFINPEPWWARYVPQFWIIPIILSILLLRLTNSKKILPSLIVLSMLFNGIYILTHQVPFQLNQKEKLNQQMRVLKLFDNKALAVHMDSFKSNRERLDRWNINYQVTDNLNYKYKLYLSASTTVILTNDRKFYDMYNEVSKIAE